MRRAIMVVSKWRSAHRQRRVKEQHGYLSWVVIGHCQYYGITGNGIQIGRFRRELQKTWRAWLNRRCHRAKMTWARFHQLSKRFPLPTAIACHSVCRVQQVLTPRSRMRSSRTSGSVGAWASNRSGLPDSNPIGWHHL